MRRPPSVRRLTGAVFFTVLSTSTPALGGSGVTFSLDTGVQETQGVGRSWYGTVRLAVSFDALFLPRVPANTTFSAPPEPAEEKAPSGGRRKSAVERPRRSRGPLLEGERALAREAVLRALREAGFASARRRLFSLVARAKSSALLPELRLGAGRSTDASLRLTPTLTDPDRYTQTGRSDLWVEARLTWRLDRLLFADEEIAIERLIDARDDGAQKLVARVVDVFLDWSHAKREAMNPDLPAETRAEADAARTRAEILLDVLTGGWFGERAARAP